MNKNNNTVATSVTFRADSDDLAAMAKIKSHYSRPGLVLTISQLIKIALADCAEKLPEVQPTLETPFSKVK